MVIISSLLNKINNIKLIETIPNRLLYHEINLTK